MGQSAWRAIKGFASRHPVCVSIFYIVIAVVVGGVLYRLLPESSVGAQGALSLGVIISIILGLYLIINCCTAAAPPANHQGRGNNNTTSPSTVVGGITVQVPMEGHLNPTQLPNNHSSSPTEAEVVVEKPPPPYVAPPSYDELANI